MLHGSVTDRGNGGARLAKHRSVAKRQRQNEKRRIRNHAIKSRVRTLVKRVRQAIEQGDAERATAELRVAARALDKAVGQGVLHRNNASRRISRLARQVSGLQKTRAAAG
jgi:small subunit ribosomal protein S20